MEKHGFRFYLGRRSILLCLYIGMISMIDQCALYLPWFSNKPPKYGLKWNLGTLLSTGVFENCLSVNFKRHECVAKNLTLTNYSSILFLPKKVQSCKIWPNLAHKKGSSPIHGLSFLFLTKKVQSRKIWPNLPHI